MKKLLLFGALALSINAFGQDINALTDDGKKVILKTDGTWEYVEEKSNNSSFSYVQYSGIRCEDAEGINENDVKEDGLDDFTGLVFECRDGMVHKLSSFKDGKQVDKRQWFSNGKLAYEANYKDGNLVVQRGWLENGQLIDEANFKDGKLDGIYRQWHVNGQLMWEKNYKDGKIIDDKVITYNEDGAISETEYYKDGKLVRYQREKVEKDYNPATDESGEEGW